MSKNVFGEELKTCSKSPMTGFYRDGCCNTGEDDHGVHTVCVVATAEFPRIFQTSRQRPEHPCAQYRFSGLKPGDRWCLCASRWVEAYRAGKAPLVILEATHERTLDYVDLHELVKFAWKKEKA